MGDMKLIVAIINFFKSECQRSELSEDTRESLEVAIQCLQTAYDLKAEDLIAPSLQTNCLLPEIFRAATINEVPISAQVLSPEVQEEAEKFKNEGNTLMKLDKHAEAADAYTKAINLDDSNAVYYCNRAAAYSRTGCYEAAINDCEKAIALDPKYSKAYARMGLAYVSLGKCEQAIDSYKKAIKLDPNNESYQINLKLAQEKASKPGQATGPGIPGISGNSVDVQELFSNPVLRNMATTMMQDPNMFNILSGLVSNSMNERGMDALLQAGQQFAAQMQASNPQLIEQLRQQVLGGHSSQNPDNTDSSTN